MAALAAAQRSPFTRLLDDDLRIREVSDKVFKFSQVVVHSVCEVQNGWKKSLASMRNETEIFSRCLP